MSTRINLHLSQEEIFFDQIKNPESTKWNVGCNIKLSGNLNINVLMQSIQHVVESLDIFQLRVEQDDGFPYLYKEIIKSNHYIKQVDFSINKQPEIAANRFIKDQFDTAFDFSSGELYEFYVLKLSESEIWWCSRFHHILIDGYGISVFCKLVSKLYTGLINEQSIDWLQSEKSDYLDAIEESRQYVDSNQYKDDVDYWESKFVQLPESLLNQKQHQDSFISETFDIEIPNKLRVQLDQFTKNNKSSLLQLTIAALSTYFSQVSEHEKLVFGIPLHNRFSQAAKTTVGMFTSLIPFCHTLSSEQTVKSLLEEIKAIRKQDSPHQRLPLAHLKRKLANKFGLVHELFDIVVNHGRFDYQLKFDEVISKVQQIISRQKPLPLHLFWCDFGEHQPLILKVIYRNDYMDEREVSYFSQRVIHILQQLVNLDSLTSDIDIVTPTERNLIQTWGKAEQSKDFNKLTHQLFEEQVIKSSALPAVVFETKELTYKGLNEKANQLAHYLIDKGVTPGTFVGICLPRSFDLITAILGILKAGAVYVPLDPNYPLERLEFMIEDSNAQFILMNKMLTDTIPLRHSHIIYLDDSQVVDQLAQYPSINLYADQVDVSGNDLAYVIYTSGSTGKPKGTLVNHKGLVNMLLAQKDLLKLSTTSRVLQFASISFDAATWEWSMALTAGAALYLFPQSIIASLDTLSEQVANYQLTHALLPPAVLPLLDESNWKSVRNLIIGGDSCPLALAKQWAENRALYNAYGPTEATVCATISQITAESSLMHIGKPFLGVEVYVLNNSHQFVPIGMPGELYIGGVGVARGYLNRPELTAEKFIQNPFTSDTSARLYATGDLVRWLPDGNLVFMGRIDHQVKIRGFRIELGEIEAQITHHDGIKEAVVAVREEQPGDKRLIGYVVLEEAAEFSMIKPNLMEQLATQLPDYMVPSALVELTVLPLTPNGKIDRKALPKPEYQSDLEVIKPTTKLEWELVAIWQQVLRIDDELSLNDNFFALGGHSLLAAHLSSLLHKKFKVDISVKDVFTFPTIEGLVNVISQARESNLPIINPTDRSQPLPLSYAQQRLWFVDKMDEGSQQYHIPLAYRLVGDLNVDALSQAIKKVLERHESIRTIIRSYEDNTSQLVFQLSPNWYLPVTDLRYYSSEIQQKQIKALKQQLHKTLFDLSQDLMLRTHLVRITNDEFLLLMTMHHIASDGWSMGILIDELNQQYNDLIVGKEVNLPELPIQYGDYSVWQRQWLQGEVLAKQLAYWREQLTGIPEVHSLPLDKPRPAVQQFHGQHFYSEIDTELTARFKALCQSQEATLFMGLHAILSILISRYSGETDIVVGTPVANREQAEVASLIGFFVNTLVLRSDLSEELSFNELLVQCKQTALNAYVHQQVPFDHLVESLQPSRSLSYHPLFQVMLALQNNQQNDLQLDNLNITRELVASSASPFDLTLNVLEKDGTLTLCWEYKTDLFHEDTIAGMARRYEKIMEFCTLRPGQSVFKLPILTNYEEQQLININSQQLSKLGNNKRLIHELFEEKANEFPNTVAVVCESEQITYSQLNKQASQLAHYLVEVGVKPDNIVAICLERSIDLMVAILAILKAGGAYLPLDPTYPDERLNYMLEDSGVIHTITNDSLLNRLNYSHQQIICLDSQQFQQQINLYPEDNIDHQSIGLIPTHLAYLIYTSGSTGKPKGVMVEHHSVADHIDKMKAILNVKANDRVLQFYNIGFDTASEQVFVALFSGATLYLHNKGTISDREFANQLITDQLTHIDLPTLYAKEVLLPYVNNNEFWQQVYLRCVSVGGDVLPIDFAKAWASSPASQHAKLINVYGPTETTISSTYYTVPQNFTSCTMPIGTQVGETRLYVLDKHQSLVPIGVPGELYIGGERVARGYLGRPELTEERFLPDLFIDPDGIHQAKMYRTGDRVRWLSDGNLEFLGRIDNQVKIRGFRIELGEIEAQLNLHAKIKESIVIAQEGNNNDKTIVAYLVVHNQTENEQNNLNRELEGYLKKHLPDYMIPTCFIVIDQVPLTPNQKVDRQALPTPIFTTNQEDIEPPSTEQEQQLLAIWQKVLDIKEPFGTTNDFFSLGGHSILAVRLIAAMNKQLNFKPSIQQLFANPTIKQLADLMINENTSGNTDSPGLLSDQQCVTLSEALLANIPEFVTKKMDRNFRHVLLTGATGFVGAYLLHKVLTQWSQSICYCVVRAEDIRTGFQRIKNNLEKFGLWQQSFSERIIVIKGDLNQANLGIEPSLWESLGKEIDLIIHNGAWVNHVLPFQQLKAANVDATLSLINLASKGERTRFVYISTTGVFSHQAGRKQVTEETPINNERHLALSGYGASKWMAEQLLLAAQQQGMDLFIFRLGRVTADSVTGKGVADDVIGRYLRSCFQLKVYPDNTFEEPLISVDTVADVIVRLVENQTIDQRIFHLTGSQTIDWNLLLLNRSVLNELTLNKISWQEWLDIAKAAIVENSELPIAPYLHGMLDNDNQLSQHEVSQILTEKALIKLGIRIARINDNMLNLYLIQLAEVDEVIDLVTDD